MKRIDELTLMLLDGTIEDEALTELAELTQTSEGRESLAKLMELESCLQASAQGSVASQVLDQIQKERCDRVEAGVMRAVGEPDGAVPAVRTPGRASRVLRLSLLVVSIAACLFFVLVLFDRGDREDDSIALLNLHGANVTLVDVGGSRRLIPPSDKPIAVLRNETIETSETLESAEVLYADGTTLQLHGETSMQLTETALGAKQITILAGLVQADVTPQPDGRPLRIVTQAATLEVLGTTLGVEVRPASTQLGVATGRVAMTRKSDGQRVEVEAGKFATATASTSEPLQALPFPDLPLDWSEDFESGLPAGWRTGKIVEHSGSSAVSTMQSERSDNGHFVMTTHNAWQEGDHALCRINADSVLHLRFRQKAFARITIMVGSRSYPPATGRTGTNLFYTKKAWNEDLEVETWKTISVPLKEVAWQMKQGVRVNGAADLQGLAAYLIHVSTMEKDAGLAIDRMWITNEPKERQP